MVRIVQFDGIPEKGHNKRRRKRGSSLNLKHISGPTWRDRASAYKKQNPTDDSRQYSEAKDVDVYIEKGTWGNS